MSHTRRSSEATLTTYWKRKVRRYRAIREPRRSSEPDEPTIAVIYCHVSSKNQEADGRLEAQETRCREYADQKGCDVAAVFPDTVTGGGDFMKRSGMVALLSFLDAQPNERFVVIFDDLKRQVRDTEFHLSLRREMAARVAVRECLNFKFDDSPEGRFSETVFAAHGQLEREQNGRQVAQKMKARMQNEYWIHTASVGYRYETVKGRGKMLFALTSTMFHVAWDARRQQAHDAIQSGKRQIREVEDQIETLLSRIFGTQNTTIIGAYE